jgi:ferredoxin-NADP reductase
MDSDAERIFVVSGPPPMVAAMERVLDEIGADESRRLVERFGKKE